MESFLGSRSLGEESLQMWELNKRLEAYLARVKSLEEENGLLRSEIQGLRASPLEGCCWRGHYEEEVAALRATLDRAFREKHAAELTREALHDQVQRVKGQCQKERAAREEAKRLLVAGRKELEEERRAQLWLQEKVAQLEKEAEELAEAHQEELAGLEQEAAGSFSRTLQEGFRTVAPAGSLQPREVEDYAQQLSAIWQGAVETYKRGVSQAEASLGQATEELRRAVQGNRQSQLQLQQLESDLAGLKSRKEALEETLARQGQLQQGEAEKLQLAVESLEEEKRSLGAQIAQVLEDRQQLMHLKMSLSLEVATYRTLLEAESSRLQLPATMVTVDFKLPAGLKDLRAEANGGRPQAASLERGRLGSRAPRPSPAAFLKGNASPRSPGSLGEPSFVASPVAREFQKANSVLRSQSAKGFDVALSREEAPAFADSAAFKLGASQQSRVITTTQTERVSQAAFSGSLPAFDAIGLIVPDVLEESGASPEEKGQKGGEDGVGTATHVQKAEEREEKGGSSQEGVEEDEEDEEEEEEQPSDEPPGRTPSQNVPPPSWPAAEVAEMAIKEVNRGDVPLGSRDAQNGFPSNDSSSVEEENQGTPGLSRKEELDEDWMGDGRLAEWPEDMGGFEASAFELNGGQEAHAERRGEEEEGELWVLQEAGPASPLEEEGIRGEIATLVAGEAYTGTKSPEHDEDEDGDHLPTFQADGPEEVSERAAPGRRLGKEAPAQEGLWEPAPSHGNDPTGATGGGLGEAEAEGLEVMSTEAPRPSEDEETREPRSPSGEREQDGLRAERPGRELRQDEGGFAPRDVSPLSHAEALPLERPQEDLFLQGEQEKLEGPRAPLCRADSASPVEEAEVGALELEAFSVERTLSRASDSARNEDAASPEEPGVTDGRGAEEEEEEEGVQGGEGTSGHRGLREEENGLGKEGALESVGLSGSEDGAGRSEVALLREAAEDAPAQEIPAEEPAEGAEGERRVEQKTEEGGVVTAAPEAAGCTPEGAESLRGADAIEAGSEEAPGALEMEEATGQASTGPLEDRGDPPEGSEAQQAETEAQGAGDEQQVVAGEEEEASARGPSAALDASRELETPSEAQSDAPRGPEATGHADTSCPRPPSDSPESEESLESADTSPNAACEGDGIEKELKSGRQRMLEETLPDHTPLRLYEGEKASPAGESQPLSEGGEAAGPTPLTADGSEFFKEETQKVLEEGSLSSPSPEDNDKDEEGIKGAGSWPAESGETAAAKDPEEMKTEKPEPELPEMEESFTCYAERSEEEAEKEAEGRSPQREGDVDKDPELPERAPEGGTGPDFAGEPAEDKVFQADPFDPVNPEEGVPVEGGGSLELSDQEDVEAPHKDSPLTSVADLGEIVLEGEGPAGGQAREAEPEGLARAEIVPDALEPQRVPESDGRGREGQAQEGGLADVPPRSEGFLDPSPGAAVSALADGMKDADILEIVEQALEFNQELVKAAEQSAEAGLPPTRRGAHPAPEERGLDIPVTSPDGEEPQAVTEVFPTDAKDQVGSSRPWAESDANGLQADPDVADFTEGIRSGLGPPLPRGTESDIGTPGGEPIQKSTALHKFPREEAEDGRPTAETVSHSPPPAPSAEEALRAGEVSPEAHGEAFLDLREREALDAHQDIFAEILQTARGKGAKERQPEGLPIAPDFGDDLLRPQPSRRLAFRPEGEEEPWPSEGN